MGRITIFNTISAVVVGALGAVIGLAFGREGVRWGALVGGVSGFVFPFYPIALVARVVGHFKRHSGEPEPAKHDEEVP